MKILGIDPGYALLGYGVVEQQGNNFIELTHGVIRTSAGTDLLTRYEKISIELQKIIDEYSPKYSGVEKLYFNKNVKTAINVAQARGIILLTLQQNNIAIEEFTPIQIKQGVTGYGRADKKQVQKMVQMLLSLKDIPKSDDAADALAIALCSGRNINFKEHIS